MSFSSFLSVPMVALVSLSTASAIGSDSIDEPQSETVVEELVVWGRAEEQKGKAMSASQGLVGYADFETRPLQRVGELVEVVPGMVATQHSGEGKANQFFLRGINLDHGTDFSVFFEGMPVNLRAHAHGQGYLDLNFLIPEILSTVRYSKGPYSADRGDFSTAGSTSMALNDKLDRSFVDLGVGEDGFRRMVTAGSIGINDGHLLSAVEVLRNDGPWALDADVKKTNALLKYTGSTEAFDTRFVLSLYDNEWNATDQIPQRLVTSNQIDRFDFIDESLGGDSSRYSFIAGLESERFDAGLYASRYQLNLFSNFTYFLEDQDNGDQFEQEDSRWIYGGHANYRMSVFQRSELRLGGDFRFDKIEDANLFATTNRSRRQTIREDEVDWLSLGAYVEFSTRWTDRLRTTLGLRLDHYDFDVSASLRENSGSGSDQQLSPSVGLAYEANDYFELYLNWGRGFHSNDVRGATISVDPVSGDSLAQVEVFAQQEGAEIGVRFEGDNGLSSTLTYFWLESDSELLFAGDSGATEPGDGSRRTGIEWVGFWNITPAWTIDLNVSFVDSEFVGVERGVDHIPNAHGEVIGAGITYTQPTGLTASVRVRHFADAPLNESDSISRSDSTIVNVAAQYQFGQVQLGLELHNVLDAEDDDIAYFFESRLPGEPSAVEDVHFHPVIPRTIRASLRWHFE